MKNLEAQFEVQISQPTNEIINPSALIQAHGDKTPTLSCALVRSV
jgi:hypothetical protein